jgi:hypothetical protein
MVIWGFVVPIAIILGALLLIGIGVSFYLHIGEAAEHENWLLPFLHLFWILTILGFIAYWMWFF